MLFPVFKAPIDSRVAHVTSEAIVNAFVSVYLLKVDTLHTADNVAHLGHFNLYGFSSILSLTTLLLFKSNCPLFIDDTFMK